MILNLTLNIFCNSFTGQIKYYVISFRYNLRRATYALIKVYGKNIRQYEMSWTYWKEVTSSCHVHDEEKNYISVKEYESKKNKSE